MCSHSGVRDNIGWGPGTCAVCGAGAGTRLPARAGPLVGGPQPRPGAGTKHSSDTGAATALAGTRLLCGHR